MRAPRRLSILLAALLPSLLLSSLLWPRLALAAPDLGSRVGEALQAALHGGSVLAFALVFLGGVLTSLTPCVYPLIPITLSIFGARGEHVGRGRALALATVYVGGIATMYTALGVGVALTGHGFGAHMGSPWVMVPIALLFVVMAASMFGAFELNLPQSWQMRLSQVGGAGWSGAFVMGLVGGIIAAPCTGPVLAALLAYVATTKSAVYGGALLFTYALGMGVLFFVLAASAVALPKSGPWMEAVKSVFGVVMLLAAGYFLRNVWAPLARYGDWHPRFALWHAGLAAAGVLLGGIHLSFHDDFAKKLRKGLGVALLVVGGFGVIAWATTAKPFAWVEGDQAAAAQAKAEGKPLLLDFGADWCIPCREINKTVFGNDEVRRELAERFVAGHVDCTDDDDDTQAAQARWRATTLPTVIVLDAQGREVRRWHETMPVAEMLDVLRATH